MPTKKVGQKVEKTETPKGLITHYGRGWREVSPSFETSSVPVDENHFNQQYVHVQSEFDTLVNCGRYRRK